MIPQSLALFFDITVYLVTFLVSDKKYHGQGNLQKSSFGLMVPGVRTRLHHNGQTWQLPAAAKRTHPFL